MIKTYKDLRVWELSHQLVLEIYIITRTFPTDEKYGIVSQLRRSSASIPTNIAEGFKRNSKRDFCHFVNIAEGSLEETKYHIFLSKELAYINEDKYFILEGKCNEIGRMLYGLRKKLMTYDLRLTT